MGERWSRGEQGQAAVEAALVLPVLLLVVLGILQLTAVQQARLMLEYAAFSAARAGAVWNMDPEPMESAAALVLLPTLPDFAGAGRDASVDTPERLVERFGSARRQRANREAAADPNGVDPIAVEALNPSLDDFAGKPEIEFDLERESLEERRKTQLTVRVTYLYELRVPLAGWVLFEGWRAAQVARGLLGPGAARGGGGGAAAPCDSGVGASEGRLAQLSAKAGRGRYYLPLVTTYTMRMQSNPFRRFARPRPGGC